MVNYAEQEAAALAWAVKMQEKADIEKREYHKTHFRKDKNELIKVRNVRIHAVKNLGNGSVRFNFYLRKKQKIIANYYTDLITEKNIKGLWREIILRKVRIEQGNYNQYWIEKYLKLQPSFADIYDCYRSILRNEKHQN